MSQEFQTYFSEESLTELLRGHPEEHVDGPTVLSQLVSCARRVRLDAEGEGAESLWTPRTESMHVGTLVHKMVELFHTGHAPESFMAKTSKNTFLDTRLDEAWQLFEKYRYVFPADFWGRLIGAELKLEAAGRTAKIDALWDCSDRHVLQIESKFGVKLEGPGVYAWDLKTAKQRDSSLSERYLWDPQLFQYLDVLQANGRSAKGFMLFKAVRYKTDRQDPFSLAAYATSEILTEDNRKRHEQLKALASRNKQEDTANPSACFNFNQMCPHRASGVCHGY